MFHSIRWRIAIPYFLLILVVMLGLGIYLSNLIETIQLQDLEKELSAEAHLLSDFLSSWDGSTTETNNLDKQAKHQIFTNPRDPRTEAYITGRFG